VKGGVNCGDGRWNESTMLLIKLSSAQLS